MSSEAEIKRGLIMALQANIGEVTGSMYAKFYEGENVETAISSASVLLSEFLGERKGQEVIQSVLIKYNYAEVR